MGRSKEWDLGRGFPNRGFGGCAPRNFFLNLATNIGKILHILPNTCVEKEFLTTDKTTTKIQVRGPIFVKIHTVNSPSVTAFHVTYIMSTGV